MRGGKGKMLLEAIFDKKCYHYSLIERAMLQTHYTLAENLEYQIWKLVKIITLSKYTASIILTDKLAL